MSPSWSFSKLIATLQLFLTQPFISAQHSKCQSHLSCFHTAGPCAMAANENSGEVQWETSSRFMYISRSGYHKRCLQGKCPKRTQRLRLKAPTNVFANRAEYLYTARLSNKTVNFIAFLDGKVKGQRDESNHHLSTDLLLWKNPERDTWK